MKRQTSRRSTKTWAVVWLTVAAGLSACQSLVRTVPLSEQLAPLDMVLSAPLSKIEQGADAGDGQAQLAMAIIFAHGLHGQRADEELAGLWSRRVAQNRRFMPITQYTAVFNGVPSRVNIINVAFRAVSSDQILAVQRCVAWLTGDPAVDPTVYGDAPESERRKAAWAQARHH